MKDQQSQTGSRRKRGRFSALDVVAWIAFLIPCAEILVIACAPRESWNATWLKAIVFSYPVFALPFAASLWYLPIKALKRLEDEGVSLQNWTSNYRVWLALMPLWILVGSCAISIIVVLVRGKGI